MIRLNAFFKVKAGVTTAQVKALADEISRTFDVKMKVIRVTICLRVQPNQVSSFSVNHGRTRLV